MLLLWIVMGMLCFTMLFVHHCERIIRPPHKGLTHRLRTTLLECSHPDSHDCFTSFSGCGPTDNPSHTYLRSFPSYVCHPVWFFSLVILNFLTTCLRARREAWEDMLCLLTYISHRGNIHLVFSSKSIRNLNYILSIIFIFSIFLDTCWMVKSHLVIDEVRVLINSLGSYLRLYCTLSKLFHRNMY